MNSRTEVEGRSKKYDIIKQCWANKSENHVGN
jgi:hypothetical protein